MQVFVETWEQFWGQRITWKLVEGLGSLSCIDMLSEAMPITACQYGAQLQLQWNSVPPEAGTQLLGAPVVLSSYICRAVGFMVVTTFL